MIYGRGKVSVLIISTYVTSTFSKYLVILHTYTARLYMDSHVSAAKRELTRFPELPGKGRAKLVCGPHEIVCLQAHQESLENTLFKIMGFGKRSQLIPSDQNRINLFPAPLPLDDLNRFCFSPFFMSQEDPCGKRSFSISQEKIAFRFGARIPSLVMLLVEGTKEL